MDLSKFLSKTLGIYLIIISLAMLVKMNQFLGLVAQLINDPPLMFVTGFFTLILGILMVVSHNIWQWHWRVLITIIAWLILLKGASILFYPEFVNRTSIQFITNMNVAYISAGFDLILGIILTYLGFKQ